MTQCHPRNLRHQSEWRGLKLGTRFFLLEKKHVAMTTCWPWELQVMLEAENCGDSWVTWASVL